jgi:uncharacterized membrane protein YfcA
MEIIGYFAAILIGFTLGLIGGGGSILTVPVLVYIFQIDPVLSTGYSLFVVGISSVVGALSYMKKGLLSYRTAIVFAIPSFIAVFLTRKFLMPAIPDRLFSIGNLDITTDFFFVLALIIILFGFGFLIFKNSEKIGKQYSKVLGLMIPAAIMVYIMRQFVIPAIPHELIVIGNFVLTKNIGIMIFFSIIMILSAYSMIKGNKKYTPKPEGDISFNYPLIVTEGAIVGTITGIVGAGGGFLIIPALVLLANLPMKMAVGTSLLIISVKSLIGFLGDVANQTIDWKFLLIFSSLSIGGIFVGTYTTRYISAEKLKRGFGWFILAMGIYIFIKESFL